MPRRYRKIQEAKLIHKPCPRCKQPLTIKPTQKNFGCPSCSGIFKACTGACIGELITDPLTGCQLPRLFPEQELAQKLKVAEGCSPQPVQSTAHLPGREAGSPTAGAAGADDQGVAETARKVGLLL